MSTPEKTALITGAAHRVGNVVARHLANIGYAVGVHYHTSQENASKTVDDISQTGGHAVALQGDVSNGEDTDRLVSDFVNAFGRIDVLVTCASVWESCPLEETTAETVMNNFRVNALGTFLSARAAGLVMAGQESGGSIVTVGDWAIERPYCDYAAYFIAKGAIPTMTRMLAVELASRNLRVRVNCVHPGPVLLPPDTSDEAKQLRIDSTLLKQVDCPEAIAHAVQFFADNPFVTGTCVPIDGGRSIFANEK